MQNSVSLGIGENEPAAPVLLAKVVQRFRTQGYDPFDLIIAAAVGWFQIEMHAVLYLLALGYLNEQQPRPASDPMIMHSSCPGSFGSPGTS